MRRRALLTLSGLQHADLCVGSVALPRFDRRTAPAASGTALHAYNALLGEQGRHAADEAADSIADGLGLEGKERAIFFARARALDLQIPEGALYEVPLCLRADGTVEAAAGGQGSYLVPEDTLVVGTLDIVFATPEPIEEGQCPRDSALWTPDLKTGKDGNVAPVDRNWQARASALLGARYFGAEAVVPAILYPTPDGGTWDVPMRSGRPVPLRGRELAEIEAGLRALAARAEEQIERVAAGKLPTLTTGAHCTYCAARPGCPAHVAEARALVTGEMSLLASELTPEQAVRGAGLLGPVRAAAEALEAALKGYVREHGPIQLPGGKVYAPQVEERTSYYVRALYEALRTELDPLVGESEGARLADLAFKATKEGVYSAIGVAHEAAGLKRQKKAAFTRITTKQFRASCAGDGAAPEVVTVTGEGDECSVEREDRIETLPIADVEKRWPIVLQRVAERTTGERWSVHYPKVEEDSQ